MASNSALELGTFEQYMTFAGPHMLDVHFDMQRLSPIHRRAFAGNCAERWYPAYRALISELALSDNLRPLLDAFWGHILGRTLSPGEVESLVRKCADIHFGHEQDSDYFWDTVAAVGAAWSALNSCYGNSVEFAVRASATIADSVFQIARCEGWPDLGIMVGNQIDANHLAVARHPLMIEERAHQRDVVCYLRHHPDLTPRDIHEVQHLGVTNDGPWEVGVNIARRSRANRQVTHEER